jgi:hypothetical protein
MMPVKLTNGIVQNQQFLTKQLTNGIVIYFAVAAPAGVWKLLTIPAIAEPLGYISL